MFVSGLSGAGASRERGPHGGPGTPELVLQGQVGDVRLLVA